MVDRSRLVDGVPTSLLDLGFSDVGLDSGFEDCHARTVGGYEPPHMYNRRVYIQNAHAIGWSESQLMHRK